MKKQDREASRQRLREGIKRRKAEREAVKPTKKRAYKSRGAQLRRYIGPGPYRVWAYVECGIVPDGDCPDILPDSYKPISIYFDKHEDAEAFIEKLQAKASGRPTAAQKAAASQVHQEPNARVGIQAGEVQP